MREMINHSLIYLLFLYVCTTECFVLEGSPTSYAQFQKWCASLNNSFSFEFQTEEPNGLLMYTDDGGVYDFYELKLVEGALRLRFNLGGGASILTVGRNLHDSQWHRVEIGRNVEETILRVDNETERLLSKGRELVFGNQSMNSYVYVGGLPSWYNTKLNSLALPSVFFEPRFKGAIRNIVYCSGDGSVKRQEMISFKGVRSSQFDVCEHSDPCKNGGICISTDSGAICNCKSLDFEGTYCEKEKAPSEITFRGTEILQYDLRGTGGEPVVSASEVISLYFKTKQANGLLFYTGNGDDFLKLSLRGGGLVVVIRLGSGTVEKIARPGKVRFDDNQWHQVTIRRRVRDITPSTGFCHLSLTADGIYTERGSIAGSFSLLSSSLIYLGGLEFTPGLRGRNNFVGCIRKVEFLADTIALDLIEMAKTNNKLVQHHGSLQYYCQEIEAADPITFTTKESFLVLPTWENNRNGNLNMKFRTNEPNAVLLYNSGDEGDYFALELLDGHVFLLLNLGSGTIKVQATSQRVADGHWHTVSLKRSAKSGRINVDDSSANFTTPGNSNQLDLRGPLYLGGIAPNEQLPSEMWAGNLLYGYVGCIRHLVINNKAVDIADYAKQQDSGSIRPSCHAPPNHCDSQPCLNDGVCVPGWNRFSCDCSFTNFIGPICAKAASTLTFDGNQYLRINLNEGYQSEAEDLGLRFRTLHPTGLLFSIQSNKSSTYMIGLLELGQIKVIINVVDLNKVIYVGRGKNDNKWHKFWITRRGLHIEVTIDKEIVSYELSGHSSFLDIQTIHLGSLFGESNSHTKDIANFVGQMQHFYFNGKYYIEMVRNGQISNFQMTAKFNEKEQIPHHSVTFKSKYTYIGLPQLKAYFIMNLYFQFKTLEPNGLILYNGGKGQDYFAIELINGHLYCVFNMGDGTRKMKSNTQNLLNDNMWHFVIISRLLPNQYTMMVDDVITTLTNLGPNIHLDLDGLLYFGGVKRSMYNNNLPQQIHSKHGFEGCVASVDMMGESVNLIQDAIIPSTLVAKGCAGPVIKCSTNACANDGICVQMWNSYTCNCDMTSFSGPTCSDESIAYEFGPRTGIITFVYPPDKQPDSKTDMLALGFMTMSKNAVLVRIDSGNSNDYLELEIVDGYVFVVYNMGTGDHPIGEPRVHVNDGLYHVVRFTRSGSNSTIQVDDHNVRTKTPQGRQLTIFDNHSQIQIGGKKNALRDSVDRPFQGVITGIVFNGNRLLDMSAEDDPRISVEGDVELLMSLPYHMQQPRSVPIHDEMQQQPSTTYESDDLVFSGSGSGCWDDEDECGVEEFGTGDDLITPVYIPPTPKPTPTTTTTTPKPTYTVIRPISTDMECDDEEDCTGSSGMGELVSSGPTVVQISEIGTKMTDIKSAPPRPSQITVPHTEKEFSPEIPSIPQKPSFTTTLPIPIESTTRLIPPVYEVPIPELPSSGKDQPKPHQKTKRSADNTALVIGIIAGILIFIVFIALIVYSVCRRSLGAYKVDEGKTLQYPPSVAEAPMPPPSIPQTHMNGSIKTATKLTKKKDLKEWYV